MHKLSATQLMAELLAELPNFTSSQLDGLRRAEHAIAARRAAIERENPTVTVFAERASLKRRLTTPAVVVHLHCDALRAVCAMVASPEGLSAVLAVSKQWLAAVGRDAPLSAAVAFLIRWPNARLPAVKPSLVHEHSSLPEMRMDALRPTLCSRTWTLSCS